LSAFIRRCGVTSPASARLDADVKRAAANSAARCNRRSLIRISSLPSLPYLETSVRSPNSAAHRRDDPSPPSSSRPAPLPPAVTLKLLQQPSRASLGRGDLTPTDDRQSDAQA